MTTPPDSTPAATPTYFAYMRGVYLRGEPNTPIAKAETVEAAQLIARALNERAGLVLAATQARAVMGMVLGELDASFSRDASQALQTAVIQCVLAIGEVAL